MREPESAPLFHVFEDAWRGPLVVKTAAALRYRIGAGASFHGGGLVTDKPDSPHLLTPKIKARMYFGIASNDDARQPDAKDKLKKAFGAQVPAEIEVYSGALHGANRVYTPEALGAAIRAIVISSEFKNADFASALDDAK